MTADSDADTKTARGIVTSECPDSGIVSGLATIPTSLADTKCAASRSPNGKQWGKRRGVATLRGALMV